MGFMTSSIQDIESEHPTYPKLLKEIPKRPHTLHIWGSFPITDYYVSIVGTRRATPYGTEMTEKIVRGLQGHSITIVSGLALGIDTITHQSAIAAGLPTVAVIGSGLSPNTLYPQRNKQLAHDIVSSGGCVISEYDYEASAAPWTFPERNRIVAGLSHATIVVEAPEKSGALITTRLALDYNRDVGAVPGSIFSDNSAGPHMLLKNGAALITSSYDILAMLGLAPHSDLDYGHTTLELAPEEKIIYECLGEPRTVDDIIRSTRIDTSTAQTTIGMMEIRGIIKRIGSSYIRNL